MMAGQGGVVRPRSFSDECDANASSNPRLKFIKPNSRRLLADQQSPSNSTDDAADAGADAVHQQTTSALSEQPSTPVRSPQSSNCNREETPAQHHQHQQRHQESSFASPALTMTDHDFPNAQTNETTSPEIVASSTTMEEKFRSGYGRTPIYRTTPTSVPTVPLPRGPFGSPERPLGKWTADNRAHQANESGVASSQFSGSFTSHDPLRDFLSVGYSHDRTTNSGSSYNDGWPSPSRSSMMTSSNSLAPSHSTIEPWLQSASNKYSDHSARTNSEMLRSYEQQDYHLHHMHQQQEHERLMQVQHSASNGDIAALYEVAMLTPTLNNHDHMRQRLGEHDRYHQRELHRRLEERLRHARLTQMQLEQIQQHALAGTLPTSRLAEILGPPRQGLEPNLSLPYPRPRQLLYPPSPISSPVRPQRHPSSFTASQTERKFVPNPGSQEGQPSPRKKGRRRATTWQCMYCPKVFLCESKLQRHILSHTKEKPFACYCGQSFSQKSSLKSHVVRILKQAKENPHTEGGIDASKLHGSAEYPDLLTATTHKEVLSPRKQPNTEQQNRMSKS